MKIEICEQMVQSWLQNCQLCEIVQTNWMISPKRMDIIDPADIDELQIFMKDVQERLNEMLGDEEKIALQESLDEDNDANDEAEAKGKKRKSQIKKLNIFKKSTPSQFLRQCEIDVVGVRLDEGITDRIYLVDTAFHKTGLGYSDPVARVLKKIIRALAVAVIIFGESVPVTVAFAAPVCRAALEAKIETVVKMLRTILGVKYSNIGIELYFNERFATEIYLPLKKEINVLNNDNDLFMRGLNLAAVAEGKLPASCTAAVPVAAPVAPAVTSAAPLPKRKNEALLFDILNSIIKDGKMTAALLDDLQKRAYAKNTFKMPSYPILLEESRFSYHYSAKDRVRFYKRKLKISGKEYLVCSQWTTERINLLEIWCKSL